ncbi:MAG: DUF4339 domain-containing protein [Phycisphaerales bacterium]
MSTNVDRRFYCIIDGKEHGPLTARELMRLAAQGVLRGDDLVWANDAPNRVPANALRGLFPKSERPTDSTDEPTDRSEPVENQASSHPRSTRSEVKSTEPVVRLTRIFSISRKPPWCILHRYHLIAVCEGAILDARFIRRPRLQEGDFTTDGITAFLTRSGSFVRRLPLDQSTAIRCQALVRKTLFNRWLLALPFVTLTVRSSSGTRVLRMHRRDAPNVIARIEEVAAITSSTRWLRRPSALLLFGLWFLFMLMSVFVAIPLGELGRGFWVIYWPAVLVSSIAVLFPLRAVLTRDETANVPIGAMSLIDPRIREHNELGAREPFRSTPLGWAIKLIAGAWIVGLLLLQRAGAAAGFDGASLLSYFESIHLQNIMSSARLWLTLPAVALLYYGHSLLRRRDPRSAGDARKPLLYLRSFALDGRTSLQPRGFFAAMLGVSGYGTFRGWWDALFRSDGENSLIYQGWVLTQCVHPVRLFRLFFGVTADSTEHSLANFFSKVGPVVAIGRPGERVAETGAHREYVKDDEWRDRVGSLLQTCQGVLLQPAQSEGMAWELRRICETVPLERVLINIPTIGGAANDYENLIAIVEPALGVRFPRSAPFCPRPVFLWFERDGAIRWSEASYRSPASWLFRGDAVDLEYTLRPFLQGMHGGEREQPRAPRRFGWPHSMAALLCLAGWLGLFGLVLTPSNPTPSGPMAGSRSVSGVAPSYAIDIPISWDEITPTDPSIRRHFRKHGVGGIAIITTADHEDFSQFTQADTQDFAEEVGSMIQASSGARIRDFSLISAAPLRIGEWCGVELRHRYILTADGTGIASRRLFLSDTDGTVIIFLEELDGLSGSQQRENRDILASLRKR